MSRIRPPVKYIGGKYYQAEFITSLFPEHHTYTESFGGMGACLLLKTPSKVEIFNDINLDIYNLFKVLREDPDKLQRYLYLSLYHEEEFRQSLVAPDEQLDNAQRAARFYIKQRQSIGGMGTAFSCTLHRSRSGVADVVSGWLSSIDENLPKVIERLRQVQILNRDGIEVIQKWDSVDTLHYIDTPYVTSTRTKKLYEHELDDDYHERLAGVLKNIKGKFILSGYDCALYERIFGDFHKISFDIANHSAKSDKKERKIETLLSNFELVSPL